MIPKVYKEALKRVTKGRIPFSSATPQMTRDVNEIIYQLKVEHPDIFREKHDGSILPMVECFRL